MIDDNIWAMPQLIYAHVSKNNQIVSHHIEKQSNSFENSITKIW